MDSGEILQRLERLEAQCAVMREALEAAFSQISEALNEQLCDAAGERARLPIEKKIMASLRSDAGHGLLDRLRRLESAAQLALQALTRGMADVPAERDKRCAALRVKAKRALREALGLVPRGGSNDLA